MAKKPRVHEIASETGIDSKTAMKALKAMGEYPKGPSSSIEPPVGRKLRALIRSGWQPGDTVPADLMGKPRTPVEPSAAPPDVIHFGNANRHLAVLAQHLPHELPVFADTIAAATGDTAGQQLIRETIESGNLFYAPGAAAGTIAARGAAAAHIDLDGLPTPVGFAVTCSEPGVNRPPEWVTAWRVRDGRLDVVQARIQFYPSPAAVPELLLRLTPLELRQITAGTAGYPTVGIEAATRLAGLIAAIPITKEHEYDGTEPQARPKSNGSKQGDDGTQLIYLRRRLGPAHRDGEAGEREHRDSQWFVRGHWRDQYYPSEKDHHRIWIDQHLAGNTGGDVVARRRVYVIRPLAGND